MSKEAIKNWNNPKYNEPVKLQRLPEVPWSDKDKPEQDAVAQRQRKDSVLFSTPDGGLTVTTHWFFNRMINCLPAGTDIKKFEKYRKYWLGSGKSFSYKEELGEVNIEPERFEERFEIAISKRLVADLAYFSYIWKHRIVVASDAQDAEIRNGVIQMKPKFSRESRPYLLSLYAGTTYQLAAIQAFAAGKPPKTPDDVLQPHEKKLVLAIIETLEQSLRGVIIEQEQVQMFVPKRAYANYEILKGKNELEEVNKIKYDYEVKKAIDDILESKPEEAYLPSKEEAIEEAAEEPVKKKEKPPTPTGEK